jgi:hypothetical protein
MEQQVQQPRKFGVGVGSVLLLFATIAYWRGHLILAPILAVPGGLLALGGLFFPTLLVPVERRWMAGATVIGNFNTRVLLTVAYYTLITPMGLVFRLLGRDPLDRHPQTGDSYWTRRSPVARALCTAIVTVR